MSNIIFYGFGLLTGIIMGMAIVEQWRIKISLIIKKRKGKKQ